MEGRHENTTGKWAYARTVQSTPVMAPKYETIVLQTFPAKWSMLASGTGILLSDCPGAGVLQGGGVAGRQVAVAPAAVRPAPGQVAAQVCAKGGWQCVGEKKEWVCNKVWYIWYSQQINHEDNELS